MRAAPAGVTTEPPGPPKSQQDFFGPNGQLNTMKNAGYYPVSVDIQVVGTTPTYIAVFQNGIQPTTVQEASAANFGSLVTQLNNQGWGLVAVKSYISSSVLTYSGLFRQGTPAAAQFLAQGYRAFATANYSFKTQGYYLISVDVSLSQGVEQYLGLWAPSTQGQTSSFWVGDWNGFAKQVYDEAALGRRLADMRTWTGPAGSRRYSGLFLNGTGDFDVVAATTQSAFTSVLQASSLSPIRVNFESGYHPPLALSAAFHGDLDPSVVGYSYAVRYGGALNVGGFGYARAPWDPHSGALTMDENTRLDSGSVTKTVTATAVYQLMESPGYNLAPNTLVLPILAPYLAAKGYPVGTSGNGVSLLTVDHLLQMTSGLNTDGAFFSENCDQDYPNSGSAPYQALLACVLQQPTVDRSGFPAEPPVGYYYSDGAYLMLRALIEAVTGQSYEHYVNDAIFSPAGINTGYLYALSNVNCAPALPPPYTEPRYYRYLAYQTPSVGDDSLGRGPLFFECGNGALQFSASQLGSFVQNLAENDFLSPADTQNLFSLNMGKSSVFGGNVYAKNGAYPISAGEGPSAAVVVDPLTNTQMSVLMNTGADTYFPRAAMLEGFARMRSTFAGTYSLQSFRSGLCASLSGTSDNTVAVQNPCEAPTGLDQSFVMRSAPTPGQFYLEVLGSGKCLTVADASTSDNANMIQYDCNAHPEQLFTQQEVTTDGWFTITNVNSGRCVTVANNDTKPGIALIQYQCVPGAPNQEWRLNAPTGTVSYPSGGAYALVAASTGMCAGVTNNSMNNDQYLDQEACAGGNSPAPYQEFVWQSVGGGRFTLMGINSGKCMTVYRAKKDNNEYIVQDDCTGYPEQTFTLQPTPDGKVNIVNDNSGMCVTVAGNSGQPGAALIQYQCVPQALNQEWTLH
jgi:CubicO group peptidase (beta-lactamase class C family)